MSDLFRKEALEHSRTRLTGAVIISQSKRSNWMTSIALIAALLFIFFLAFAGFSRKETVKGYLYPDKGVIKSYSTNQGVVNKVFVSVGDHVKKGDALVEIITQTHSQSGQELNAVLIEQIHRQIALLDETLEGLNVREALEAKEIQDDIASTEKNIGLGKENLWLATKKIQLLAEQIKRYEELKNSNGLSIIEWQSKLEHNIVTKQEYKRVQLTQIEYEVQLRRLNSRQLSLPQKYANERRQIKKEKSQLLATLNQAESRFKRVVQSTHDGTITSVTAVEGETLHAVRPLVILMPKGSNLIAELLLPTRSAGFIKKGDKALLRFDAFPYQRFGFLESEIFNVDKTLIDGADKSIPIELKEPVYRLQSYLKSQSVLGYGQSFQLKSGMLLEADIVLERRTILQWFLDPIYSMKGKLY